MREYESLENYEEGEVEVEFVPPATEHRPYLKAESAGTLTVTAQLSVVSGQTVTVPFTVSGTASSPADYTITASPIVIPAGATSGAITITVADDALDELDETVVVTMGAPGNGTAGGTITHTATITDNDPQPSMTFTTAAQSGAENEGTITVTAQLSAISGQNVTVPFTVSGTGQPIPPTTRSRRVR